MKRAILAVLLVFLLLFSGFSCAENQNMIPNGGFEDLTSSGMPDGWYTSAYRSQPGYSRMSVAAEKAHSGQYSVVVENASANDARFICTVKVKPESLYRLSGYVFVDKMEDIGNGANFGVEGIYSSSEGIFDTAGQWQYIEWYGETGEDQTEVTLGLRVGGYSAESTGRAYFDDIVLEEVDSVPDGVIASLWFNYAAGAPAEEEKKDSSSEKSTGWFVILACVFLGFVYWAYQKGNRIPERSFSLVAAFVLIVAVVLRIILAVNIEGYEVDINCFRAWSMRVASVGPANFYAADYFCDYPPGALLLLWPIGALLNSGIQTNGAMLLCVKLLPLICDMLGAFCVWKYAKKYTNSVGAVFASCFYLFNPAVLVNGAAWGQMDSVLALLLTLTAFAAMKKKWDYAIPLFVVSALVKPQALLFGPIGVAAFGFEVLNNKKSRNEIFVKALKGMGIALAAALVIVFPFAFRQEKPLGWLISLYGSTLGSYAYATLNTANLYYLAGANWTALTQSVPALICVVPAILLTACAAALVYPKTAKRLCGVQSKANVLAALMLLMAAFLVLVMAIDADYSVYGYGWMAFSYLFAITCMFFDRNMKYLPFYMALALVGVYVLGVKVHERYLFPAMILLLVTYINSKDRRVLWLFAGFSATTFVNTAIVLDNSILFGAAQGHLNADTMFVNIVLCVLNLALCVYAGLIGLQGLTEGDVCKKQTKQPEKKAAASETNIASGKGESYRNMLLHPRDYKLRLTWRDYLIIGITTVAYAVLAFSNLGSTVAPQTAWVSTSADETVVFELEEDTTFSVLYYAGVSYRDFAISASEDGVNWSQSYPCQMREGLCYRWNYAVESQTADGKTTYFANNASNILWLKGKYLKVEACEAGLNLWEVVARDQNGANLALKLVENANAHPELLIQSKPAANLIDETDTCVGEPGWYNGTYFDEIYHARTGYEHLHGQAPYETTHPPLGKLMMSAAIAIFGMTPFGWRFAGALIGVLMLPAIYLLAMQLTHKRNIASISMLALAFDLMHFTQTRIATIDSFPVFFIMLTYVFMFRYMQMDSFAVSDIRQPKLMDKAYLKTLVPLCLCGVCMGLSIASKWIGMYSGVGLAFLFFMTMYRHLRVNDVAWGLNEKEFDHEQKARIEAARTFTVHRIAITCGFCVLFFVIIPAVIYCLCYIPYLSPTGPVTLKRIMQAQQNMLNYHSQPGLGADHPFQSPWWQWPFILKPMWYCQDTYEPVGFASTISCFGNPWVFYIGAVAMVALLVCWVRKYLRIHDNRLEIAYGDGDLTLVCICVGFLVQYLPWVLVPRSMYMYHYFASVPFIIMATAILIDKLTAEKPVVRKVVTFGYLVGTIVFFVMFFPYASGYLTSTEWLDAMKWFKGLYY